MKRLAEEFVPIWKFLVEDNLQQFPMVLSTNRAGWNRTRHVLSYEGGLSPWYGGTLLCDGDNPASGYDGDNPDSGYDGDNSVSGYDGDNSGCGYDGDATASSYEGGGGTVPSGLSGT